MSNSGRLPVDHRTGRGAAALVGILGALGACSGSDATKSASTSGGEANTGGAASAGANVGGKAGSGKAGATGTAGGANNTGGSNGSSGSNGATPGDGGAPAIVGGDGPGPTCADGSCPCMQDDAACEDALLLSVGPSKHFLVTDAGAPFQVRADAPWTLAVQLTREDVTKYLDDRQAKHFNAILVELIEPKFGAKAPANVYGDLPFVGDDFAAPNETYWKHVDYIVEAAKAHHIVVLMSALYLGYEGGDEGWYVKATAAGASTIQAYGAFVGARYQAADNIVWVNGGDFRPPTLAIPDALAAGILSADKRHLLTTHWGRNSAGTDGAPNWLTLNSSYTDLANTSSLVLSAYQAAPVLPTFVIEARYEGSYDGQPALTAKDVRGEAWQGVLSGACGFTFGNHVIWPFDAGWQAALNSAGAQAMQHLFDFFEGINWWTLVPSADASLVTAGQQATGSVNFAAASAASDGSLAVVYVPDGREISVSMAKFRSNVVATWFDPSTGKYTNVAGSPFAASGVQKLDAPGSGDSVLLLQAN
jgi:hypothetical protein